MGYSVAEVVCRVLILLIVFPAHELAHAVAATALGDPTPRAHGRLTLNPIKHLDPLGSLMFIIAGIGWASTPVNPAYFGDRRRLKMGLVSLTGPLTNLALAVLGVAPFYLFGWVPALEAGSGILPDPAYFFTIFIFLNLLLAFFNLIPIAPLDGAQVLGALIPEHITAGYEALQRYGYLFLILLLFVLPRIGIDLLGLVIQFLIVPIMTLMLLGLG
ncbi:MAG: site-2 protease family protein [Anaerolineales bacterium]